MRQNNTPLITVFTYLECNFNLHMNMNENTLLYPLDDTCHTPCAK
jgi:hypothetical protein